MDSFISWVGGKRALRPIILPLFPAYYERYIEVFGGAEWMMFYKPPDKFEVFNDFNGNLVNMYRVVKERTAEFIRELNFLTLNSRDDFKTYKDICAQVEINDAYMEQQLELTQIMFENPDVVEIKRILDSHNDAELQKAVAFYKLIHFSYASGCKSVACQPLDIRRTFYNVWQAHGRLANVFIENKDFEAIIKHYARDSAFFYCDPPYFETEGHYEAEFKKDDHIRLRDALETAYLQTGCKWLVSYNDCEYIRELYKNYNIMAFSRLSNMAQRYEGGAQFEELLIANYDFEERGRLIPQQLTFFDNNYTESGVIVG